MGVDAVTGYWSEREILGYGAKFNIVLSDRGRGKSWRAKHFLMQQKEPSMCLYRDTSDQTYAMERWIAPLIQSGTYQWDDFEFRGDKSSSLWTLYYQGEPKIWFRTLTQVNHIKQESFPEDMAWVWLDEFIPLQKKKLRGIDSEGDALRAIVKTIEHDTVHSRAEKGLKNVRVLMFANPFTWDNEILRYFKINPFMGFGVHRVGSNIVCEMLPPLYNDDDPNAEVDAFLGDEVHKNIGWMEQNSYVKPLPKGAKPQYSVRIGDEFFILYHANGLVWVKKVKKHGNIQLSLPNGKTTQMRFGTLEGLKEDEICLDKHPLGKRLHEEMYLGAWYYPDINTKFAWINALEKY